MSQSEQPIGDSVGSRIVHSLQSLSSRTAASALAAGASLLVLGWALTSGRPDRILLWFEAVATAVTLVMVFALQHTQTRQQAALQRKLDEILHALPEADSRLINLESASEEDIAAVEQRHSAIRNEARD